MIIYSSNTMNKVPINLSLVHYFDRISSEPHNPTQYYLIRFHFAGEKWVEWYFQSLEDMEEAYDNILGLVSDVSESQDLENMVADAPHNRLKGTDRHMKLKAKSVAQKTPKVKEFVDKWSIWWRVQDDYKELTEAFERHLDEIINAE